MILDSIVRSLAELKNSGTPNKSHLFPLDKQIFDRAKS